MRWCNRCILPDTRPGLDLDADGVCSACRAHEVRRDEVDWAVRAQAFAELAEEVRGREALYDCVIPVSGGKDSTWQAVTCLEHGLRPLTVTWRPPARTPIGTQNLDNLVSIGVDHIDYRINPRVEAAFLLRALERSGTSAIPMHLAIFAIPTAIAVRFRIPLVVWGENSAAEYIGSAPDLHATRLDSEWVRKYGAVHGTTAEDWISEGLDRAALTPYFAPSDGELAEAGVDGVFLGQFFRWDPERTAGVARAHGFESSGSGPKTGLYDYADIDDDFISIHHYLKWHKFGFTRTFDNLSLEIRNDRLTRDDAIDVLRRRGDERPAADIARFCDFVGITEERFDEIAEAFRNPEIWSLRDGVWQIEDFLIPDWEWT